MSTDFWVSWQLWEKLCFCLGSGIVLVIILGILKLSFNAWQLRRYTAVAEHKAAVIRDIVKDMPQEVRSGGVNEVPFGARAIQSGIEVDGVWVSSSNTPASSAQGSPRIQPSVQTPQIDLTGNRSSSNTVIPRMELTRAMQTQAHSKRHPNPSSTSGGLNGASSSGRLHDPPPTSDHQKRGRVNYEPRRSSQLRYSDSTHDDDEDNLEDATDLSDSIDRKGKSREVIIPINESQKPSTRSSSIETESKVSRDKLDSMSQSVDWPLSTPNRRRSDRRSSSLGNGSDTINTHESRVDEKGRLLIQNRQNGMTWDYGPVIDISPDRPASPEHRSSATIDNLDSSLVNNDAENSNVEQDVVSGQAPALAKAEKKGRNNRSQALQQFDGNRQSRVSQVIRKVNSGFEILQPGTLNDQGLGIENNGDDTTILKDEKKNSRRLQKKRRIKSPSTGSSQQEQDP